mgnify:CR=1 FL=1
MKLCNKNKVLELIRKNHLVVESNQEVESHFLDELRFGLKLGPKLSTIKSEVDLNLAKKHEYNLNRLINLDTNSILESGKLYLGSTQAKFQLPSNLLASIHTRSKFARIGLEFLCSSNIVIPDFGAAAPAEIIFEIKSSNRILNFYDPNLYYAFLLFYELEQDIPNKRKNYKSRVNNLFR